MLIQMIGGEKRNVPAAYALRLLEQGKAVRVEEDAKKAVKAEAEAGENNPQPEAAAEEQGAKEPAPAKRKAKKEPAPAE